MTLMMVDDSPLIITRLEELLRDIAGITGIKSCGTYTDAVELLDRYDPTVALLDIKLPDKSGIELLKYIKASSPETIVIMISNQTEDSYKNHSLQLGADHYIDKSKDFEKLPDLVCSYSLAAASL